MASDVGSPVSDRVSTLVETARGPTEYAWVGSGPTVLLIHGGHSSYREELGVRGLLSAGFSVLIPSRPGYGRTPLATGAAAETAAHALVALLDLLRVDQVHVLGMSAGGPTSLHMAALHPQRVRRLVLACAVTKTWHQPGDGLYETMQRLFGRWQGWTWWATRTAAAIAPRAVARTMMQQFTSRDLDEAMAQLSEADVEVLRRLVCRSSSGRGFLADLEHRTSEDLLRNVPAETLIVHSRFDGAVPFDHATHAAQHIPKARIFEAPTLGHVLWVGPGGDLVDETIAEFLGSRADDAELARRPTSR